MSQAAVNQAAAASLHIAANACRQDGCNAKVFLQAFSDLYFCCRHLKEHLGP